MIRDATARLRTLEDAILDNIETMEVAVAELGWDFNYVVDTLYSHKGGEYART